jgi:hypothetical protein
MAPELVVMVSRPDGDVPMYCEIPKPWFHLFGTVGNLGLHVLSGIPTL